MKGIVQVSRNAGSSLQLREVSDERFLPTSVEIQTRLVPLLPYDLMKFDGRLPVSLPNVPGYGAVGQVLKVGALRSKTLENQRVLVLHPSGTFRERFISSLPPLSFVIPDSVSDKQAASVIGGFDAAWTLHKKIKASAAKNIVITGANSLIGLSLLQLLNREKNEKKIFPLVRESSRDYFEHRRVEYGLPNYPEVERLESEQSLVIDIAGKLEILSPYLAKSEILSVALQGQAGVTFISEMNFPGDYVKMLEILARDELRLPIDQIFAAHQIREAVDYQASHPSRGRNLISFAD